MQFAQTSQLPTRNTGRRNLAATPAERNLLNRTSSAGTAQAPKEAYAGSVSSDGGFDAMKKLRTFAQRSPGYVNPTQRNVATIGKETTSKIAQRKALDSLTPADKAQGQAASQMALNFLSN